VFRKILIGEALIFSQIFFY